jgi:hypothetical protein
MNLQDFIDHHPGWFAAIFPIYFLGLWLLVSTVISVMSGWFSLGEKFRNRVAFNGKKWWGQSGQMRWLTNYTGCLILGANSQGLYLGALFLFRFMHPPLLVPWGEIRVRRTTRWLFGESVTFTMGHELGVNLRISGKLADKLRKSAEDDWPIEDI